MSASSHMPVTSHGVKWGLFSWVPERQADVLNNALQLLPSLYKALA